MKGQMSMSVIIGAAIALLILVIVSVLLFNMWNSVDEGTSCGSDGRSYCELRSVGCGDGYTQNRGISCDDAENEICCIEVA